MSQFIEDPFDDTHEHVIDLNQGGRYRIEVNEVCIDHLRGGETGTRYRTTIGTIEQTFTINHAGVTELEGVYPDRPYKRRMVVLQGATRADGKGGTFPAVVAVEQSPGATVFVNVQAAVPDDDS